MTSREGIGARLSLTTLCCKLNITLKEYPLNSVGHWQKKGVIYSEK